MTQTITAMYDDHHAALRAEEKLVSAGIPRSAIKVLTGAKADQASTTETAEYDDGIWGSLKSFFMPEEDRRAYGEGLNRGGTMLSASVEDAHADKTYDIMEEHGSIDLDEREKTWRSEGWDGSASAGGRASAYSSGVRKETPEDKDYIPVVEERLNVGKRMVDNGRVRVRSYAVTEDVEQNVTLRDETVQVDRRTVDRPVTAADEALFADKTIEASERREQAVVSKTAHVIEEIGISKDAGQRTETVSDTLRHTKVEVEDDRTGGVKPVEPDARR